MPKNRPSLVWTRLENEVSLCPGCGSLRISLLDAFKIPRDRKGRRLAFLTGCHACGLLFANPLPTQAELERQYAHDGAWVENRKTRAAKPPVRSPQARDPRAALFEALSPYVPVYHPPPRAKVLDFGCGIGKYLDQLQDAGWETYGIEPSNDVAFRRHRGLERPPQDASFDFVILHHVLEHVVDPLGVLRQLAGAMREGAPLFIGIPRLDTLPEHGDFKYCLDGRHHLVALSERCLSGLLARAGFSVIARLDARELDRELTRGIPLRLRLVATRTMAKIEPPAEPLAPALEALTAYVLRRDGPVGRLRRLLPVRMRAALLDQAVERRARKRRRAKR